MVDTSRDLKGEVETLGWEIKKLHYQSSQLVTSANNTIYEELKLDTRNSINLFDKVQ